MAVAKEEEEFLLVCMILFHFVCTVLIASDKSIGWEEGDGSLEYVGEASKRERPEKMVLTKLAHPTPLVSFALQSEWHNAPAGYVMVEAQRKHK